MRIINVEQLKRVLGDLPANPRVVASGNFATPQVLLGAVDEVVPEYRLHMLNAQKGLPDREGVTYETAFVGPGMRGSARLDYVPCRLSLVPVLFRDHFRPDVVLLHASSRRFDTVSLVIVQANVQMPYTYGDAQIYEHEIDYLVEPNSTLQLGIGSVPDAVLAALTHSKGLRI